MKKKSIQQENKGKIEKELQNFVYIPNIFAKSLEGIKIYLTLIFFIYILIFQFLFLFLQRDL